MDAEDGHRAMQLFFRFDLRIVRSMIGSAWECSNKEELQEALSILALATIVEFTGRHFWGNPGPHRVRIGEVKSFTTHRYPESEGWMRQNNGCYESGKLLCAARTTSSFA